MLLIPCATICANCDGLPTTDLENVVLLNLHYCILSVEAGESGHLCRSPLTELEFVWFESVDPVNVTPVVAHSVACVVRSGGRIVHGVCDD